MGNLIPFRRPEPSDVPAEVDCPRCGRPVDSARIRCTHCGALAEGLGWTPRRGIALWMWLGVALAFVAVAYWIVFR